MNLDAVGLFITIAGFIVGLGAVTVIDLHGFLGRHSSYWTEATTRTHKVTKPLIWIGIALVVLGSSIFFRSSLFVGVHAQLMIIAVVLIGNGCFLSFRVSPFLLDRERAGRSGELLPTPWQRQIAVSFILSFVGWWGALWVLLRAVVG